MAKVKGSSMAVPASPPIPGRMPSTSPIRQPSARNIRRWGSISRKNALPAASAMNATSAAKPSIDTPPLRQPTSRLLSDRACSSRHAGRRRRDGGTLTEPQAALDGSVIAKASTA
jgi:hypothetical protein